MAIFSKDLQLNTLKTVLPNYLDMHDISESNLKLPLVLKKNERISIFKDKHVRVISKRGRINLRLNKIPDKSVRYARDLFNTLVNMRWRWIILIVFAINISAYVLIGSLFWFDAWYSGDFEGSANHTTCVRGIHKLTSFFMLGIETITTTGYGYFYPTEFCRLVFVIVTISTLITIFIDGAFISVVYVKFGRPTYKMTTDLFSKKAIISLRNGKMCFIIRLNDKNGKHWIDTKINLFMIRDLVEDGKSTTYNYVEELPIKPVGPIFWPVDIVHEIDENSPMWTYSPMDIIIKRIEIIAIISGCSTQTGQLAKTQTSYLSKEILWGHRFTKCLEYNTEKSKYFVCKKKFNETRAYDTPLCSTQKLASYQ